MKRDNYFTVSGWMVTELKLKGNELMIFAIIYGFSQDGESVFKGSINYLCEWLNVSRPTVIKSLQELCEKELIEKEVKKINGVVFNRYRISLQGVKKLYWGGKETLPGGSKETLPHIYNNDIIDNIIDKGESNKKIAPPQSLFEGTDFDKKKKSLFKNCKAFDFEYFEKQFDDDSFKNVDLSYYFHSVNDWSLQKNQLRTLEGWIATARTWMRNDLKAGKLQQKKNGSGMRAEDLEYLRMTNGDFNY